MPVKKPDRIHFFFYLTGNYRLILPVGLKLAVISLRKSTRTVKNVY